MPGSLRVTQTRSTISHIARNRGTVRALGLRGIGSTVVLPDNEAVRGMVRQVRFLVSVEEIADSAPEKRTARKPAVEERAAGTSAAPARAARRTKETT